MPAASSNTDRPPRPGFAPPAEGRRPYLWVIIAASMLAAGGCGGDDSGTGSNLAAGPAGPTIVVTTSVWADVVSNVACGNLANVETIVPVGGDPHAFEPSLSDRRDMDDADLIVSNGLLLEEGLQDTIDASEDAGTPVFRMAEHLETITFSLETGDGDGGDPHVWFDPQRVSSALPDLASRLVDEAGLDAAAVAACLSDYQVELAELDADIAGSVAELPDAQRQLVTSHDSLGYFADRYGFVILGTVIPASSTLAETNPAQLEQLAELIETTGAAAIFAETQHSTDDIEALSSRLGDVEVVTLFTGTLGEPGTGADTYIGLLWTNAQLITTALSGN